MKILLAALLQIILVAAALPLLFLAWTILWGLALAIGGVLVILYGWDWVQSWR